MLKLLFAFAVLAISLSVAAGQNSNSSAATATPSTNANKSTTATRKTAATAPAKTATAPAKSAAAPTKTSSTQPKPKVSEPKPPVTASAAPGAAGVLAAFNSLLDGIRHANVNEVTSVYWNSPQLTLFNNNGTVTKGWDQMRKNRESSYRDLKDVKLDVRDVSVTMLGRDGAVVDCLWTQSQTYKGTPETASGRMTLVFKRVGNGWKAIHLHTSPDREDPSRVLPSEQTTPAPTASPSPSPSPSPTPR